MFHKTGFRPQLFFRINNQLRSTRNSTMASVFNYKCALVKIATDPVVIQTLNLRASNYLWSNSGACELDDENNVESKLETQNDDEVVHHVAILNICLAIRAAMQSQFIFLNRLHCSIERWPICHFRVGSRDSFEYLEHVDVSFTAFWRPALNGFKFTQLTKISSFRWRLQWNI